MWQIKIYKGGKRYVSCYVDNSASLIETVAAYYALYRMITRSELSIYDNGLDRGNPERMTMHVNEL